MALVLSMSVSLDGFVNDRDGGLGWGVPDEELFAFHTEHVRGFAGILLGRRLYETMLVWETDPAMREDAAGAAFADVWTALPKVVFSRTLAAVEGTARLAEGSLAEEAAALAAKGGDVEVGGAALAGEALAQGLLDELRIFRHPVVLGGGTPLLPPVAEPVALRLVRTRAFASGVVLEHYARAE